MQLNMIMYYHKTTSLADLSGNIQMGKLHAKGWHALIQVVFIIKKIKGTGHIYKVSKRSGTNEGKNYIYIEFCIYYLQHMFYMLHARRFLSCCFLLFLEFAQHISLSSSLSEAQYNQQTGNSIIKAQGRMSHVSI